jgi:hypothetical protein
MKTHTIKNDTHVVVMEYEFELLDAKGRIQHGVVDAGTTHTSAAWASLVKSVRRPLTGWLIRVRRIGNSAVRTRVFLVRRDKEQKLSLTRVDTNA